MNGLYLNLLAERVKPFAKLKKKRSFDAENFAYIKLVILMSTYLRRHST